jgi:hypothetical protein
MKTARLLLLPLLVAACSREPETVTQEQLAPPVDQAAVATAAPSAAETGTPVSVPSDPRANYWILSKDKLENGNLAVVTRRSGPSGESYARREIDCGAGTVRYLGEGDTLAQAQTDSANVGDMTVPVSESITGVITATACGA